MCRMLIVNNASSGIIEDKIRMYIHLLGLPVELETAYQYSDARFYLCSNRSYDLLLTTPALCGDNYELLSFARQSQPQAKQFVLRTAEDPCTDRNYINYLGAEFLNLSTFYDFFAANAPDTVSRSKHPQRPNQWLDENEYLLDRVLQVLQIIRENYMNDLSLNDLAHQVYSSPCYLSTLFTRLMGISPIAYLNEYRMEKAVEMLQNSTLTVTDICRLVGYRNLPYFCTRFKSKYHMTPAQFRQTIHPLSAS